MTTTAKTVKLSAKSQAVLDGLVDDELQAWYDGEAWIVGNKRGSQSARRAGREIIPLVKKELVEGRRHVSVTHAGIEASNASAERKAELHEALRVKQLPLTVNRPDGVCYPEKVITVEPCRIAPRDGHRTYDVSALVQPEDYLTHDHHEIDVVIRIAGKLGRHAITFSGPDAATRRQMGGPLVKGVHAGAYALAAVIAANRAMGTAAEVERDILAGRQIEVQYGDVIEIRGYLFVVERANNDNIQLTRCALTLP